MDQPGIEIRPIVQITGGGEFNETFFTDAVTEADLVVGEPGHGWRVAMGLLGFERGISTLAQQVGFARDPGAEVDPRTTRVVSRVRWVSSSSSPAISATSIAIASCPSWRIGCCTVVSGGCGERGLGDVVEADHRQLPGHVDAQLGGDLEGRQRGDVVGREDRGRRVRQRQQRPRRLARLLGVEGTEPRAATRRPATPAAACASR